MKTCNRCGVEKELDGFSKNSRTNNGYNCWCKDCVKEYRKEYKKINKDKLEKYHKQYRDNNKDKIKEYHREYNEINKERKSLIGKNYYELNKKRINNQHKEYRNNNKEKINLKKRQYHQINKDRINLRKKNYRENNRKEINLRYNKRKKEDIQFRLSCNLRGRLRIALKNDQKIGSAIRDLGCTINYLKQYLESKFQEGMSWNNYGAKEGCWNIDHIIPLSKVDLTNREDLLKVCNYKNLQPMWHTDNVKKGNR